MKYTARLPSDGINVSKTDPRKEALFLVVGVGVCLVVLLALISFSMDLLMGWVPFSWEIRAVDGWDQEMMTAAGVKAHAVDESLQKLIDRLAVHWPDVPYRFRTGVTPETLPNAFALPGGAVVVTAGLLERVESENELAFILGHELGHFRNRDHLRGLGRQVVTALAMTVIGVAAGGGGVTDFMTIAHHVTDRRFSREQELAADRFGLEIVQREYGHVAGAEDFFKHLADEESVWVSRAASYLSTHPWSEGRMERLRRLAEGNGWSDQGNPKPWETVKPGGKTPLRRLDLTPTIE